MILYHGSNVTVNKPRILDSDRYLDFGSGFYMTTNKDQASNFAKKVAQRGGGMPLINVYEFNEDDVKHLKVKIFDGLNEEWLDFVSDHRNGQYNGEQYDVIIGPVADDDAYRTLQVYSSGLLTREQAIEALRIKKLFNQYVFTSDTALAFLKFKNVEK